MQPHRFGRKIKLPATMAIKHQIRIQMAQYEVKKAEADAEAAEVGTEEFPGQPGLAITSGVLRPKSTLTQSPVAFDSSKELWPIGIAHDVG